MADFESYSGYVQKDNFYILKGRFKAVNTNTYGLFLIFIDEEKRAVENLMAIASHYSSIYDISPYLPWYSLEENIINLKWKGDIALNVSLDLQNYMEGSLVRDRGNELYILIKNNDENKIQTLLQTILMKPLGDRNISLETVSEIISKESMKNIRKERNKPLKKPEPSSTTPKSTERNGVVLDVDLILAPVSGVPIYELKKGDKIMVRIKSGSTRGNYYIDLFGARVEGNVIPVPAEVMEINRSENQEYSIFCKLDENIFGKAIETEQVKLKRYDELLPHKLTVDELAFPAQEETKQRSTPVVILVTGGLAFLLLLSFIIMWLYNII